MKQKRKVKSLIKSSNSRTINVNDVITSLLLVLGGVLLLGSVTLFTTRGVDAAEGKPTTKIYTGVASKTETVYGANFYNQEDRETVSDMYVKNGLQGANFYITTDSIVAAETNDGKILTITDKVGDNTSSSVLGGKVGELSQWKDLNSDNITVIGGSIRHVYRGNNNAALLGGDGIEIEQGSSGAPLVVIGGTDNKMDGNQDGNSLVGGFNNNIGKSDINVHILGGEYNNVTGSNKNIIVAGKYVQIDEDINNVFAFSSKGSLYSRFSPKTSNAFYLDVADGLGLNAELNDNTDGKVSSNGAVSMGELSNDDLNACNQHVSEAVGVQGRINGCAVGCTSRSATDGKWELLDKSENCVEVCGNTHNCDVYPENETKGGIDHELAYCTGIDIRDSWWDGRIAQCGGDGAEQKYEDVVFKTEIIDREDKCPGEKTPKGENQCVFRCNPGYHLVDGKCYKDCTTAWGLTIKHGESVDGYSTQSAICKYECKDYKKTMTCNDGYLDGKNTYRYPENQCQTHVNVSCRNSHEFTSKIANADCSDSCIYYQEVSNNMCIRPQTRYKCTCNENYDMVNGECIPRTQLGTCNIGSLPDNADVTINTFNQTWDGSDWSPVSKDYDANNEGECTFECKENFTQNGNSCTADSNQGTCNADSLPTNAYAVIDTFAQTWNGSEWTPATKNYAGSNTTECTFGCDSNYTKDGDECKPGGNVGTCNASSLPSNATGVIDTFAQTWNGSAWTPASKNYEYGNTTECVFSCNEGFVWDQNQAKCIDGHTETCNASSLPSNATGVIKTFAQTWNGSAWTPASKNYSWDNTTECTLRCIDGYYKNGTNCSKVCDESHSACNGGYKTGGENKSTKYTCTLGTSVVTCSCPTGEQWSSKVGTCGIIDQFSCGTEKYTCENSDPINTGYSNNKYTWKCENIFKDTKNCELAGGNLCPSSTACSSLGTCPGGGFATGMSYGEPECTGGKFCKVSLESKDGNVRVTNGDTSQWKCVNGTYVETCSVTCPVCTGTAPGTSTHTVANNSNTPSSSTAWHYSTNTSEACSYSCASGYDRVYNKYTGQDECKDIDHYEWRFKNNNGTEITSLDWTIDQGGFKERAQVFGAYFSWTDSSPLEQTSFEDDGDDDEGGTYTYQSSDHLTYGGLTYWNVNNWWWDISGEGNLSSFQNSSFYSEYDYGTYGRGIHIDLTNFYNNGIPIMNGTYHPGLTFTSKYIFLSGRKIMLTFSDSQPSVSRVSADSYSYRGSTVDFFGYMIWGGVRDSTYKKYEACLYAIEPVSWHNIKAVSTGVYYGRCDNYEHGDSKYQNGCQYRCNNGNWVKSDSSCGSSGGGSSGGGAGCFLAGTQVYMADGTTKNIEDIEVGDMVVSYNTTTKESEYNKVIRKFVHEDVDDELYELTINGNVLKVTYAHRFYVVKGDDNGYQCPKVDEWVAADHLKVGDVLIMIDGTKVTVDGIVHYPYHGDSYNMGVENVNNYYVDEGYLVHNSMMNERKTDTRETMEVR